MLCNSCILDLIVNALSFIRRLFKISKYCYMASLANDKHGYDVVNIHLCYSGIVFIFHRALSIISCIWPLTSDDHDRSMTSRYQNIDICHHWLTMNMVMMYMKWACICVNNGIVFIFHWVLIIINYSLPLTSDDRERSVTSKCQNIDILYS